MHLLAWKPPPETPGPSSDHLRPGWRMLAEEGSHCRSLWVCDPSQISGRHLLCTRVSVPGPAEDSG